MLASFFGVFDDVLVDPFDQRVLHPLGDRRVAPSKVFARFLFAVAFDRFGELQQAIGRIGAAIEQHVFDTFQQVFGDFFVDFQLAGVDDAHVQTGFDGVVQKRTVNRFANAIVAAETEADVADTAAGFRAGTFLLDAAQRH